MTKEEFIKFGKLYEKINHYIGRPAHTKIGALAISWYMKHYREEHWYNGSSWQKWKKPKRFNPKGGTVNKYGTLLSKRQHLFRSISKLVESNRAIIYTNVPYAEIHNEGGEIKQNIPITPKMRKWAWAMYYNSLRGKKAKRTKSVQNGKKVYTTGNPVADKFAALALTKKQVINRNIKMPKRPFLYPNNELARELGKMVKTDIKNIILGRR